MPDVTGLKPSKKFSPQNIFLKVLGIKMFSGKCVQCEKIKTSGREQYFLYNTVYIFTSFQSSTR